jgi:hypothetical protein
MQRRRPSVDGHERFERFGGKKKIARKNKKRRKFIMEIHHRSSRMEWLSQQKPPPESADHGPPQPVQAISLRFLKKYTSQVPTNFTVKQTIEEIFLRETEESQSSYAEYLNSQPSLRHFVSSQPAISSLIFYDADCAWLAVLAALRLLDREPDRFVYLDAAMLNLHKQEAPLPLLPNVPIDVACCPPWFSPSVFRSASCIAQLFDIIEHQPDRQVRVCFNPQDESTFRSLVVDSSSSILQPDLVAFAAFVRGGVATIPHHVELLHHLNEHPDKVVRTAKKPLHLFALEVLTRLETALEEARLATENANLNNAIIDSIDLRWQVPMTRIAMVLHGMGEEAEARRVYSLVEAWKMRFAWQQAPFVKLTLITDSLFYRVAGRDEFDMVVKRDSGLWVGYWVWVVVCAPVLVVLALTYVVLTSFGVDVWGLVFKADSSLALSPHHPPRMHSSVSGEASQNDGDEEEG